MQHQHVSVYHMGTARRDGKLVTAGGRVLCVVGLGPDLEVARERAYAAVAEIHFEGMRFRSDIAHRELSTASSLPTDTGDGHATMRDDQSTGGVAGAESFPA
jgi:phosphoribosylamine-glycine ligase